MTCSPCWCPRLCTSRCWKPWMGCAGARSSSGGSGRAASPCSRWCWSMVLVSGGSDGRLRWWDVQSGECVREPCLGDRYQEAHQGTVQSLKVSPDGSTLASCGEDGAIRLWDLESGEPLQTLRRDRPYERLDITGIRGLSDAQKASLRALGAFEDRSVGGELPALPGERGMSFSNGLLSRTDVQCSQHIESHLPRQRA